MNELTVYAKKEATLDLAYPDKRDVQIYKDPACTVPYSRFMWWQKKPIKTSKRVFLNCYRWPLKWVA